MEYHTQCNFHNYVNGPLALNFSCYTGATAYIVPGEIVFTQRMDFCKPGGVVYKLDNGIKWLTVWFVDKVCTKILNPNEPFVLMEAVEEATWGSSTAERDGYKAEVTVSYSKGESTLTANFKND